METRSKRFKEKQDKIIKKEKLDTRKKIAKRIFTFLLILFILFSAFIYYVLNIGTTSLLVKEKKITTERMPSAFHGLKVIVFSDLHYPTTFLEKQLQNLQKEINIRKPDLIFFVGDLIESKEKISSKQEKTIQNFLSSLEAKLGKYAVLGEEDNENTKNILTSSAFRVLEDDYDLIYQKEMSPILLIGLDSRKKVPDFEKALAYFKEENAYQDIFSIALFHHPDTITSLLQTTKVDFAFAGHSHNGQIRIPYLAPLIKKEGATTYYDPYYKIENTELYISSGLGSSNSPYRFFSRPSIFFFRFTTS